MYFIRYFPRDYLLPFNLKFVVHILEFKKYEYNH